MDTYKLFALISTKKGKNYTDKITLLCQNIIKTETGYPAKCSCSDKCKLSAPLKGEAEAYIIIIRFKASSHTAGRIYDALAKEKNLLSYGMTKK